LYLTQVFHHNIDKKSFDVAGRKKIPTCTTVLALPKVEGAKLEFCINLYTLHKDLSRDFNQLPTQIQKDTYTDLEKYKMRYFVDA